MLDNEIDYRPEADADERPAHGGEDASARTSARRRLQGSPSLSGAMLLSFDDLTEYVEEERAEAVGGSNNPRLRSRAGAAAKPKVPPRARRYAVRELAGYEACDAPDPEAAACAERLARGRWGYRLVKRAFDVLFSAAVLVLFSWLYLIIAVAIKVDDPSGPVIFRQARVGRGGREFTMYKFRSMRPDAEERLESLRAMNEKTGPVFKMRRDPRVTRVGRVIRKLSLDELPQFVNVLRGDLSVVGPRPALPAEVAQYTPRQRQRLLVRQGLTCYWQTRMNRDELTFDEWVDLDLLYIEQCGIWALRGTSRGIQGRAPGRHGVHREKPRRAPPVVF